MDTHQNRTPQPEQPGHTGQTGQAEHTGQPEQTGAARTAARHRAPGPTRVSLPPAALRMLLGSAVVVLVGAMLVWQVA